MKLRGLVPNFHIQVSVSDLYIPTIGSPILLRQNRWTDRAWNIQIAHRYMNVGIGTNATHFHFWKYTVPSNVLSSTYFLGKTFFFSKIFLGDPPLIFLEVCLKFRSLERWSEKFDFDIARSPKKSFSADVELRSIVPNFVTSKNSMMQMCSG